MVGNSSIFKSLSFTGGILLGLLLQNQGESLLPLLAGSTALYSYFLLKKGIKKEIFFLFCVFATGLLCAWLPHETDGLFSWNFPLTERVRNFIRSTPYRNPVCGELVTALLTGDRSGLSAQIKQSFRDSGASHLLALSGMHIGIIYLIISRITELFGNAPWWKKLRSVGIVLFCGAYTLAVGAGPSIVRAFLFILLRELSLCLERRTSSRDIFCHALILQLMISPTAIQDIGFQLSYLAMAGITFLFPYLRDLRQGGKIWESCALSISCQIFTAPLAYFKFGSIPLYFLLTNLISAPLTSLIMGSSLLLLASRIIFGEIPLLIALNEGLCQALIFSLDIIAQL